MSAASPARALQEAVFATLSGDAALAALVGGRVHDGPPRNVAAPYLHLGEMTVRDWSTGTEEGAELRFEIVAVSREAGRSEALAIGERVRALLHEAAPALEGWRLVSLRHLSTQSGKSDRPALRRAVLRFRATLELQD